MRILIAIAGSLFVAFGAAWALLSDNELQALYSDMRAAGVIRCGMTFEHLIEKYHACAGAMTCDGSYVVLGEKGTCTDRLQFDNRGGSSPVVILNGREFGPRLAPTPPVKPRA